MNTTISGVVFNHNSTYKDDNINTAIATLLLLPVSIATITINMISLIVLRK